MSRRESGEDSDDLSFSHLLRRIDENDTLQLQRSESYQYKGFVARSNEKSRRKERGSEEKEGLCEIQDLLEEESEVVLPLPVRRLSSMGCGRFTGSPRE